MNFEQATEKAKAIPSTLDDATKLKLYGLYKQATIGDVNIDQPWAIQVRLLSFLNLVSITPYS